MDNFVKNTESSRMHINQLISRMGIRTAKVSPIFSFLTAPWRTLKPNAPESEESEISNNFVEHLCKISHYRNEQR